MLGWHTLLPFIFEEINEICQSTNSFLWVKGKIVPSPPNKSPHTVNHLRIFTLTYILIMKDLKWLPTCPHHEWKPQTQSRQDFLFLPVPYFLLTSSSSSFPEDGQLVKPDQSICILVSMKNREIVQQERSQSGQRKVALFLASLLWRLSRTRVSAVITIDAAPTPHLGEDDRDRNDLEVMVKKDWETWGRGLQDVYLKSHHRVQSPIELVASLLSRAETILNNVSDKILLFKT